MKKVRLAPPRVGPHAQLEQDVRLNVIPGRDIKALRPLRLGSNALLRSGTVVYAHTRIGNYLQTGHHVIIREENRLGHHVSIWNGTTIDYGCKIGNRVKIHCNCYIAQFSELEDDVFLAPGVTIANDLFPGAPHAPKVLQGAYIRKGAHVGVNVTLLPGVTIGAGAIIGAGSVVTRDVPAQCVAWGNPAVARKSTKDLRWPANLKLNRVDARRFYERVLKGKRAFK